MPPLCPICTSNNIRIFFELPTSSMPVHNNLLWSSRNEAVNAPRGEIRLGFCEACSHVFNTCFDPDKIIYTQQYENTLNTSPRFQEYARWLALQLVNSYDLHHKDLIEIGCGRGDFLHLLCEIGDNRGIGFDPALSGEIDTETSQVKFIQDYYSEKYAHYPVDFILSRQTLEHIQDPAGFLSTLRSTIGDRSGTILFFEVPNLAFILHSLSGWDILYEHPSYYSRRSLYRLFHRSRFQVLSIQETFEGQFLTLEASQLTALPSFGHGKTLNTKGEQFSPPDDLAREVDAFAHHFQQKLNFWQQYLNKVRSSGEKAVVWGTGSKGVSFLNLLQPGSELLYAVDINPRKHGMFVAGTGQEIVPPEFLREYKPDVIIVMNAIYEGEIRSQLETLGIQSEIQLA